MRRNIDCTGININKKFGLSAEADLVVSVPFDVQKYLTTKKKKNLEYFHKRCIFTMQVLRKCSRSAYTLQNDIELISGRCLNCS